LVYEAGTGAALLGARSFATPDSEGFLDLAEAAQGGPETHAARLYDKLERLVLSLWYEDPDGWAHMMRHAIARVAPAFNSHVMMRRYANEAYRA
jgi:starch phosphorylase